MLRENGVKLRLMIGIFLVLLTLLMATQINALEADEQNTLTTDLGIMTPGAITSIDNSYNSPYMQQDYKEQQADIAELSRKINLNKSLTANEIDLTEYSYAKKIKIDHGKILEDLVDFPLTIYLDKNNFDFSKAKPDGSDIRFIDNEGNQLSFEKQEYSNQGVAPDYGDGTGNAQNGSYNDSVYLYDYLNNHTYYADFYPIYSSVYQSGNCKNAWYIGQALELNQFQTHNNINNVNTQRAYILAGTNTYQMATPIGGGRWTGLTIWGCGLTANCYVGAVKLIINGSAYTLEEAVIANLIEPLVLVESESWALSYTWTGAERIYGGGYTDSKNFPALYILFKTKPNTMVSAVQFYANTNFNTSYDGLRVRSFDPENVELSLIPYDRRAIFNVKIPNVPSVKDTEIYMVYGDENAEDGQDIAGTWDSGYASVLHLGDTLADRTGNGNNGVKYNALTMRGQSSKITYFNGYNSYIDLGNNLLNSITPHTVLAYGKIPPQERLQEIFNKDSDTQKNANYPYISLGMNSSNNFYYAVGGNGNEISVNTSNYSNQIDNVVAGSFDGNEAKLYAGGVLQGNSIGSGAPGGTITNPAYIGKNSANTGYLNGYMREVRISDVARTDSWIKAETYSLQNDLVSLEDVEVPVFPPDNQDTRISFAYKIGIPATGSTSFTAFAAVFDDTDTEIEGNIAYSLAAPYEGVSINSNTGAVTVSSVASPGTVIIVASHNELSCNIPLILKTAVNPPEPVRISFSVPKYSVSIPEDEDVNIFVSAKLFDENDNETSGEIIYSLQEVYEGVSIDSDTGMVTVSSQAGIGSTNVIASSGELTCTAQLEFKAVGSGILNLEVLNGEKYDVSISASQIQSFADMDIMIKYDEAMLDIWDLSRFTKDREVLDGQMAGPGLIFTQVMPGEVHFSVDKLIPDGKTWSGTVNVICFKANHSGSSIIELESGQSSN